jgi:hypothetical protein
LPEFACNHTVVEVDSDTLCSLADYMMMSLTLRSYVMTVTLTSVVVVAAAFVKLGGPAPEQVFLNY